MKVGSTWFTETLILSIGPFFSRSLAAHLQMALRARPDQQSSRAAGDKTLAPHPFFTTSGNPRRSIQSLPPVLLRQ
jgi:hypothetical protein